MHKYLIKAIIFDMDGVLVDSEPIHKKTEMQVCREFSISVPEDEYDNFRGKKIEDIFSFVSEKFGTGKENIEKMVERKRKIYLSRALNMIQLVSGAREFLESLKSQAVFLLALTTSGKKAIQDKILKKFGLENLFDIMVTADEIKRGKPHPESYLTTVQKLGKNSDECLVIEDSTNGILSAKNAGCIACGITTTFDREKLMKAGADFVVESFSELKKILDV